MNIKEQLIKLIAETLDVQTNEINEDTAIGDIPAWDSLGHVAIINAVEQNLGIQFEPEVIMDVEDVSDIIAAVEKYKGLS
jgi:acyl carrier protein